MNTKEKALEVLKNHNLMYISTVDENGMPKSRSVDFVSNEDGSELYCVTFKMSDKVKEIKQNNNVFIVIDNDCKSMEEMQKLMYIRARAKAYICETPEEIGNIFGMIIQKFPYMKDLPGEPSDFVGVRVELEKALLTDNSVHFGYVEEIIYK